MHVTAHAPKDLTELDRRIAAEKSAKQRDRYRAVRLALAGEPTAAIQAKLGRSRDFVQRWVYAYRDRGLAGIAAKRQPGRRPKLTPEQAAALATRLDAGPRPEDRVCSLRGQDVVQLLEREFGVTYTLDGVYTLLHRLGYTPLRPRPRHRKTDPQAQAAWVARAPLLSRKCSKPIPTSG